MFPRQALSPIIASRSWYPSCRAVGDRWAVADRRRHPRRRSVCRRDRRTRAACASRDRCVRAGTLRSRPRPRRAPHRWRPAASRSRAARRHRRSGREAQLSRALRQIVLTALTFQVVGDLIRRRLTDVDDGLTGEVLRRDLAHERPPSSLRLACPSRHWPRRRGPRPAAPRSGGRECFSAPPESPASGDPPRTGSVASGVLVA